jgi:drug/metabolite transporter (DMT)-like permease
LKLFAVGGTATIGQVFLTKAFRGGVATKVSVVGLSQVVMVMLWESIIDGRSFTLWQLFGAALVLGPTAYLMARERKKPERVVETPVAAIE